MKTEQPPDNDIADIKPESDKESIWFRRFTGWFVSSGSWLWRRGSAVLTLAAISAAFLVGLSASQGRQEDAVHGSAHAAQQKQEYTCAMHPQIRQDEPGLCPICNMDLVPVKGSGDDVGPRELKMSESARILAAIETAPVERRDVAVEIRMTGKIAFDETRVRTISAWLDGRIEILHADYTGQVVEKEADLVDIYSPELIVAQKELLLAVRNGGVENLSGLKSAGPDLQSVIVEAAREKLQLW